MSGWRVCGFGVVLASFRIAFLRSGLGTRLWIVTNGSRDSIKSWAQMGHNEFHVTCSTRPNIVRNGALRPGNLIVAARRPIGPAGGDGDGHGDQAYLWISVVTSSSKKHRLLHLRCEPPRDSPLASGTCLRGGCPPPTTFPCPRRHGIPISPRP